MKEKYGFSPSEIEILLCVEKMTSGNICYCVVSDIEILVTGRTQRYLHLYVKGLIQKDYLINHGNKKYFLELSDSGNEFVRHLKQSLKSRIEYLNDQIKIKNMEVRAKGQRKKKRKGTESI